MRKLMFIYSLLFYVSYTIAQEYETNALWVVFDKPIVLSTNENNGEFTNNPGINSILQKNKVESIMQSFSSSRNSFLRSIYTIEFNGILEDFKKELELLKHIGITSVFKIPRYEFFHTYDPSDDMW